MKQNPMSIAVETINTKRHFDESEVEIMREQFVTQASAVAIKTEEVQAITKDLREELKELKEVSDTTLGKLRAGYEEVKVECDLVPNWTSDQMEYISRVTGEVVSSRRIAPNERQLQIHVIAQGE